MKNLLLPLLLSLSLLLAACTPATQEPATDVLIGPDVLIGLLPTPSSSPKIFPTPAPSTPTSALSDITPTDTPLAPTDTPEPTPSPVPESVGTSGPLQIAFINNSTDIVLWKESDQSFTTLVGASGAIDVRLSDDGTILTYRTEITFGQQELWAVNTDGTNPRMLLGVDNLRAFDPDALGVTIHQYEWIPGTHTLAFNTIQTIEGPGLFLYDDLHFLDVDTADLTTILTPGSGGNFLFSPDGQQYALIQPESISLLNTDGSNIRNDVLTYPYVLTYSEYEYYAKPVWSPDSTFLRVAIPPQNSLDDLTAPTTLWHIPTDGSSAVQTGAVNAQPFFIDPVQFSPDLFRLAYTRLPNPDDFQTVELVITNPDSSNEVVYATGNLFFIGWAPDSQHFVFENTELQETYLGTVGGNFSLLTDIPYARDVTWIDEPRYLFSTQSATGWQFRLSTLGAGSTVIIEQPGMSSYDFDN